MSGTAELKQRNTLAIIKAIRNAGMATKPEIAAQTGLTPATVHNFINELLEKGFVAEEGSADSNGGRRAMQYRLNPRYAYILAQNLGKEYIETGVYNINLELLYSVKVECDMTYNRSLISQMLQELEKVMAHLGIARESCCGVGISVPGQVDFESGVVVNLTNIQGWRGIPLKAVLEKEIQLPVYVDNDNNANALAAKWKGIVGKQADAVFLSVTSGVGIGILVRGSLLYGSHSSIGEIGHTTVKYDGPVCSCGNRGCIEALVSDSAIMNKIKMLHPDIDCIEEAAKLAARGDAGVFDIFSEACDIMGITIDHIAKLYGPEVIIINNNWLSELQELFFRVTDRVFAGCAWIKRENLNVVLNDIEYVELTGAASLVLERMLMYFPDNILLKRFS